MSSTRPTLFVDSADRVTVEELLASGLFHGVTTNPTILQRAGQTMADLPDINRWARAAGAREVCLQSWGTTTAELLANAAALLEIDPRTVVKVPATPAGIPAAARLVEQGAQVLLTAVYDPKQMVVACALGVRYVAPYLGRMQDAGRPAFDEVVAMQHIAERQSLTTEVLAASLRSTDDVARLAAAGVPAFTLSAALCADLLRDDLSDAATEVFETTARSLR